MVFGFAFNPYDEALLEHLATHGRGGDGHPLGQKRSMNTGLGWPGARRISAGVKLMAGVTHLKSER